MAPVVGSILVTTLLPPSQIAPVPAAIERASNPSASRETAVVSGSIRDTRPLERSSAQTAPSPTVSTAPSPMGRSVSAGGQPRAARSPARAPAPAPRDSCRGSLRATPTPRRPRSRSGCRPRRSPCAERSPLVSGSILKSVLVSAVSEPDEALTGRDQRRLGAEVDLVDDPVRRSGRSHRLTSARW